jgi:hypothetical protein
MYRCLKCDNFGSFAIKLCTLPVTVRATLSVQIDVLASEFTVFVLVGAEVFLGVLPNRPNMRKVSANTVSEQNRRTDNAHSD